MAFFRKDHELFDGHVGEVRTFGIRTGFRFYAVVALLFGNLSIEERKIYRNELLHVRVFLRKEFRNGFRFRYDFFVGKETSDDLSFPIENRYSSEDGSFESSLSGRNELVAFFDALSKIRINVGGYVAVLVIKERVVSCGHYSNGLSI